MKTLSSFPQTLPPQPTNPARSSRRGLSRFFGLTVITFGLLGASGVAKAQTELLNQGLRDGSLPTGWTQTDVTFTAAAGGRADFTTIDAVLTTPIFDASAHSSLAVDTSVAKFGSGGDGPITIEYSLNGGDTWTTAGNTQTPTSGTVYLNDTTQIPAVSASMQIRFTRVNSPSAKRLRDVVVTGVGTAGAPTLAVTPTALTTASYQHGSGPVDGTAFTVSGSDLDGTNVTLAAPENFEVSADIDSGFDTSLVLADFNGEETTVFVRMVDGLIVANYSGNLIVSGGGATEVTLALSGTVTPFPVPLTSLNDEYTENFSDFISSATLPLGWSVTDTTYNGDWGSGFSAGLRGNDDVLGYQHTGTTGVFTATLTLINNTGDTIENLDVSFLGKVERVTETRHPEWAVSVDGTEVTALSYSTGVGVDQTKSTSLTGLSILNGETFTISWSSSGNVGSVGARRQIGISNVSVTAVDTPPPAVPEFNLAAGTYLNDQTVFISNFGDYAAGVNVYYTLDGTTPTSGSTLYNDSEGIELVSGNGTITLTAIAIEGTTESLTSTRTYTFPVDVADIETLRAQTVGSTLYRVTGGAVLIGQTGFRNTKFFQDDSGFGIQIDDPGPSAGDPGVITTAYDIGDEVAFLVGTLGTFQNQLRFTPFADFGPVASSGNVVTPVDRTLDSLTSDDQSRLVRVLNVSFENTGTFPVGAFETNISDPSVIGFVGIFRNVFSESDITGAAIPEVEVDIVGIIQERDAGLTLAARSLADITASPVPTIEVTGTLGALSTTYGTASSAETVTVSGSALTNDITATAPAGFEVSSDGITFDTTATFAQTDGSASGTLSVRIAETTPTGSVSGTVTLSSAGAESEDVSIPSSTVSPKEVTITGVTAEDKVYDGNTGATLTAGSLSGILFGDDVTLTPGTGAFSSKDVGTGIAVTASGFSIDGEDVANYTLAGQPSGLTANITAKSLTVSGASVQTRDYDATTTAVILGGTLTGVVEPDDVGFTGGGTFADANAGSGKPVTAALTLTGEDAVNYSLVQPTLTGTILKATPGVTVQPTASDIYEGEALSASTLTDGTATVAGSFAFTSPGLTPAAGTQSQSVTFTPADTGNFNTVATSAMVTVIDMSPTLTNLELDLSGGGLTLTFAIVGELDLDNIDFDLQTATSLESPDWTSAPNQVITDNGDGTATLSADLPEGDFGFIRVNTTRE